MNILSKNSRIVIHLVYRPTLKFLEEIVPKSQLIESDFKDWIYEGSNQSIVFFDDVQKKRLTVNTNQFEFVVENPDSVSSVKDEFARYFAAYFADSDIEEFRGYGSFMLSLDNADIQYEDYSTQYFGKFYNVDEEFEDLFSDQVSDVIFIIEGVKDGFNTYVKFAPLQKERNQINSEYPKENYMSQVEFSRGIPVLANARVSSTVVTTKDEVSAKVDKTLDLVFDLHKKTRSMATEGF